MASLDDKDTIHPAKKMKHEDEVTKWINGAKSLMNLEEIPSFLVANKEELEERINLWISGVEEMNHAEETPPRLSALKKKDLEEQFWRKKEFGPKNIRYSRDGNYRVFLEVKYMIQNEESGGDSMSMFRKVMKDAGCSESQIKSVNTYYYFNATLTPEEVRKLSGLDSVKVVSP